MLAIQDNPKLRIPFDHGWRRELVQRAASTADDSSRAGGGGIRADAYYFSPQGKKLRSIKETETYLRESGSTLEVSCFSFSRHLLGAGPPHERLRKARPVGTSAAPAPAAAPAAAAADTSTATAAPVRKLAATVTVGKTAAAATAGKKAAAAKMIQRKKHTITIGAASSVIKLPSSVVANPQKMARKHSLMEKSRKLFAFKAMELKKKMPVFQSEAAKPKPASGTPGKRRGRPPGSGSGRMPLRRPWLLAEVDQDGAVFCRRPPDPSAISEYFRMVRATASPHTADNVLIGRTRRSSPCSLFCFSEWPLVCDLALPSAQCLICRCLSHPACVGLEDDDLASFVCLDCYIGVGRGRGFDGLGDSVDADSDSESEYESESDSVEELIPGPPPPPLLPEGPPPPPPPPPLMFGGPRFGTPPSLPPGMKRPRGRPRLLGPRQPRPGAVRGAYARRRALGGGRGGARFVSDLRVAVPSPVMTATTASAPASQPAAAGGETAQISATPAAAAPVAPVTAPTTAAAPAASKKRSWKDP